MGCVPLCDRGTRVKWWGAVWWVLCGVSRCVQCLCLCVSPYVGVMCLCVGVASQMCGGAFGPGEVEAQSAKSRRQALLHSAFAVVFRPPGPPGAENFRKQDSPIIRRAHGPNSLSVGLTVEISDGALTFVSISNRTHSPLRPHLVL
jgi:hypothetical protein